MCASELLLWEDFSSQAEWCTVAKTLILASRMIGISLMPLIKVSSSHYLGITKIVFMDKWHRGKNLFFFFSVLKMRGYQKEMCYVHFVSDFNTLLYVTSKQSGLKQRPFIYSCFCTLDRAQLGWLPSAPCGVDWIHSCVMVSQLVPTVSLTCLAIGIAAWFSFAWLCRTAWASYIA